MGFAGRIHCTYGGRKQISCTYISINLLDFLKLLSLSTDNSSYVYLAPTLCQVLISHNCTWNSYTIIQFCRRILQLGHREGSNEFEDTQQEKKSGAEMGAPAAVWSPHPLQPLLPDRQVRVRVLSQLIPARKLPYQGQGIVGLSQGHSQVKHNPQHRAENYSSGNGHAHTSRSE